MTTRTSLARALSLFLSLYLSVFDSDSLCSLLRGLHGRGGWAARRGVLQRLLHEGLVRVRHHVGQEGGRAPRQHFHRSACLLPWIHPASYRCTRVLPLSLPFVPPFPPSLASLSADCLPAAHARHAHRSPHRRRDATKARACAHLRPKRHSFRIGASGVCDEP